MPQIQCRGGLYALPGNFPDSSVYLRNRGLSHKILNACFQTAMQCLFRTPPSRPPKAVEPFSRAAVSRRAKNVFSLCPPCLCGKPCFHSFPYACRLTTCCDLSPTCLARRAANNKIRLRASACVCGKQLSALGPWFAISSAVRHNNKVRSILLILSTVPHRHRGWKPLPQAGLLAGLLEVRSHSDGPLKV